VHLALQVPVAVHGDIRVPGKLGPGLLTEPPSGGLGGGCGEPYVDRGSCVLAAQVHLGPRQVEPEVPVGGAVGELDREHNGAFGQRRAVDAASHIPCQRGRIKIALGQGRALGYAPPLWDPGLVDEIIPVPTADAEAMARRLAREEGLFAGTSSGANVIGAIQVGQQLGPDATVVTLLVDSGLKYLSTAVYRRDLYRATGGARLA